MKKRSWKKVLALAAVAALAVAGVVGTWAGRQARSAFVPVRLGERQLILDAGHGGEDGGAVSLTGVPESGINLSITLKLDQLLGFYGVCPILLRETDISLHDPEADTLRKKKVSDLRNRVAAIEAVENAVLLSIHQNTFSNAAYHGAQTFYRPGEESEALAQLMQDSLREGADPGNQRTPTKIPDSIYLMKHITCPAVLVECGFLSNPVEEARLRDGGYQTRLAACMASAWLRSGEIQGGKAVENVVSFT